MTEQELKDFFSRLDDLSFEQLQEAQVVVEAKIRFSEESNNTIPDLTLPDIEALLPERSSVSIGHLSAGKWTVILRPLPAPPPKLLLLNPAPQSNTPIMATGESLGATMNAVLNLLAPAEIRCQTCGEFCWEKLRWVSGSTAVIECLTCLSKRCPCV